jgi:D-alanyl-D-alanine carboxypeptidase
VLIGWQQQGDKWYYYAVEGEMTVGLAEIEGSMYYFGSDGAMHTGWLELSDGRYFFAPNGQMQTGWILVEGNRYYMDENGTMHTGWLDADGERYYLLEDGTVHVGWMVENDNMYYLRENGVMAKGMVLIDGVKNYFTGTGAYILLVNPWNKIPEGYEPELKTMTKYGANMKVDVRCYNELMQMLEDCRKQCQTAVVCSSYRSIATQENLFENRIKRFMNEGYDRAEAERRAAQVVAVPGTSEHHLGLAVDIVDNTNWNLDESQEKTPVQKWLMANSWKYGFILRYPKGKTEVTGIIYEPWHYRYVGKELAKELYESGLTLEEYLDQLTQEANT